MADMPTIIETGKNNDNGWGNGPWGAGVGAFIGSMFGNGGFGGWGWGNNGRGVAQAGADLAIGNAIEHVSDQIQQGTVAGLQSASATQLQIANSGNAQTVAMLQGQNGLQQQICCSTGRLSQEIDASGDKTVAAINAANIQGMQNTQLMADRLCAINGNISSQGYENRLQAQTLASQLQAQHADLRSLIQMENCQDRELMRSIADQQVRDKLNEVQNELAAQKAQNNLTQQLQNQTLYLIQQLKPTTTTAAGA